MAKERKSLGVVKTVLLFLLSGIIIAAAIVVPQMMKTNSSHKLEASMKQDLLSVKAKVAAGLKTLPSAPAIRIPMVTSKSEWSFTTFEGTRIASGTAWKQDLLSGAIYTDSTFCLQVANPGNSSIWHIDSTTAQPVAGFCLIRRAATPTPTPSATGTTTGILNP